MAENKNFPEKDMGTPFENEEYRKISFDDTADGLGAFSDNMIERVDSDGNPLNRDSAAGVPEADDPQSESVSENIRADSSGETESARDAAGSGEPTPHRSGSRKHSSKKSSQSGRKSAPQEGFAAKLKEKASKTAAAASDMYKKHRDEKEKRQKERAAAAAMAAAAAPDETEIVEREERARSSGGRIITRRREKRTGCLGGVLYFLFIACIGIVLGSLGWMYASDMLGMTTEEGETIQVTVPEDFTIDSITDMLYDNGVVSYKFLFKFYANLSSADEKIKPGKYEINTAGDYRAIVNSMRGEDGERVVVEVMIPEGNSMFQIFETLAEENVCTEDELWRAATEYDFNYDFLDREDVGNPYRLEGYLFPDTYKFYVGDTPENVISKFLDNFAVRWQAAYTERANELGWTMDEVLIIASIIEREAGRLDEMGNVSSVIYNRLNSGMRLQMESTLHYVSLMTGEPMSSETDSPYNTYMYDGLPEGAIANPGIDSIYAALYPESTNYYYFALGADNFTHFFTNYDAFLAFVNSDEYGG